MKKLVLTFCMLIAAIGTWAAKAYPGPITVTQSDGTKLTVLMYGDEDGHWFTTTDNVLLSHVGTDFFIARIETDGSLQATQQLAHEPAMRNQTERQLALDQQPLRQTFLSQTMKAMESKKQRRIGVGTASPSYFPHTGTPKAMVILVQFADLSFSVADAKKSFNDYLNAEGALPDYGLRENRNHGSVCQYFTDMSQGLFSPRFDLYGPVTASKTWTYYGANSGSSDQSARIEELVREACNAINDTVDFSQYDADGDKRVDLVYVIYAGYSESMGASSDCIWPKSGTLSGGTYDGVSVSRYGVNNELNYTPDREFSEGPSKRMNGIGLFCHEFSHTMGLPDLYPTSTDARAVDNQTMEYWDVMDGGEYTDNGYTPTPYTPWELEVMGWTELTELTDTMQVSLKRGEACKIMPEDTSSPEYVILHNLLSSGWGEGLAKLGHGMLVYRIDYTNSSGTPRSAVNLGDYPNNTAGKPGVTIIPADGLLMNYYRMYTNESEKSDEKPYSRNDYLLSHAGDTYPGSTGVKEILSFQLNRTTIKKPLYNISENDNGEINLDYLKDFKTVGISLSETDKKTNSTFYDLQGRQVVLPTKGIYIRNGKKIIVK